MDAKKLRCCYLLLTVYRIFDLCCDWYCWSLVKNSDGEPVMLVTCVCGTVFNSRYLYYAVLNFSKLQPQDIDEVNSGKIILPELNFNMLEAIANFFQTVYGYQGRNGCIDLMHFSFVCCCGFGAVLQFLCFLKNLCGYDGEEKQNYCNSIMSIVGLVISCINLGGFFMHFDKKLRICRGTRPWLV